MFMQEGAILLVFILSKTSNVDRGSWSFELEAWMFPFLVYPQMQAKQTFIFC